MDTSNMLLVCLLGTLPGNYFIYFLKDFQKNFLNFSYFLFLTFL